MIEVGVQSKHKKVVLVNFYDDPYLIRIAEKFDDIYETHNFSFFQNTAKRPISILDLNVLIPSEISDYMQKESLSISTTEMQNNFLREFVSTLDRVFMVKFSGREILAYYGQTLTIYEEYFDNFQINKIDSAIIFDSTPHMPWDIVLYALAKHRGITTIIPKTTNLAHTIQFTHDIDDQLPISFNSNEEFLRPVTLEMEEKFSPDLVHLQTRVKKLQTKPAWKHSLYRFFLILKLLKIFALNSREPSYFRMKKVPLIRIILEFYRNTIKSRKTMIQRSVRNPNLDEPYVFFALHAQPERTTDPEAGIYSNQFIAIQKLRTLIPEKWKIYVKEHPVQYDIRYLHLKQLRFRNPEFYKNIEKIQNTQIVSDRMSSEILLQNAKAVATGTGSIAWEAILHGRQVITFGNTWLTPHENCRSIHENQINVVQVKQPNEINIDFMKDVSNTLVTACNSQYTLGEFELSEKLVQNFIKASISLLE